MNTHIPKASAFALWPLLLAASLEIGQFGLAHAPRFPKRAEPWVR